MRTFERVDIVGVPLLVQAKKFMEPFDRYRWRLNYPEGTPVGTQLTNLKACAGAMTPPSLPVYLIYADEKKTKNSLHVVAATNVEWHAKGKARVSAGEIVGDGDYFENLFCSWFAGSSRSVKLGLVRDATVPVADVPGEVKQILARVRERHELESPLLLDEETEYSPSLRSEAGLRGGRKKSDNEHATDNAQEPWLGVLDLTLPYRGRRYLGGAQEPL